MKRSLMAGVVLTGALVLGACGGDDFDRDGAVEDLMEQGGIDEATAGCIVDNMVAEFGEDTVSSDREPTAEEMDAMSDITFSCMEDTGFSVGDDAAAEEE